MTSRERHQNGRFKPRHRAERKCLVTMHRLRAKGWKVQWHYWRTDKKSGLLVAAVAHKD